MSALAEFPKLIKRLFNTQSVRNNGQYSLNLCINGTFKEVIVDDFVPVDASNKVKFCYSKSKIMWPILLEKAYAKTFGAYWNIGGAGSPCRALKDLTGAPTEFTKFEGIDALKVFELIEEADKAESIMVAPTKDDPEKVQKELGMIPWHAYTVISACRINGEMLVKLRNPHGIGEWRGAWSDTSKEWTEELRRKHNHFDRDDGVFFMPISNFIENFQEVIICHYRENYILSQLVVEEKDMLGLSCWRVTVKRGGEYYVSVSQPDHRYEQVKQTRFVSMMLLAEDLLNEEKLEYVGGKIHMERDPFFKCKDLSEGTYLLIVSCPILDIVSRSRIMILNTL